MEDLSRYFEKFKSILKSDTAQKKAVSDALMSVAGIEMGPERITIKGGIAIVPGNPIVRTEMMLKKQALLDEIQRISPGSRIRDLR